MGVRAGSGASAGASIPDATDPDFLAAMMLPRKLHPRRIALTTPGETNRLPKVAAWPRRYLV